jgi:hypothetical protein
MYRNDICVGTDVYPWSTVCAICYGEPSGFGPAGGGAGWGDGSVELLTAAAAAFPSVAGIGDN